MTPKESRATFLPSPKRHDSSLAYLSSLIFSSRLSVLLKFRMTLPLLSPAMNICEGREYVEILIQGVADLLRDFATTRKFAGEECVSLFFFFFNP